MNIDRLEKLNEAIKLYIAGQKICDISILLSIPAPTLYFEFKKRNINKGKVHLTDDQNKYIIELYKSGVSRKDISNKLNCHITSITKILRNNNFCGFEYITEEVSNKIANMYNTGKSLNEISQELNICMTTIHNHCKKHNIIIKQVGGKFVLTNPHFFETLTEDSSYMLGFFIADGCLMNSKNRKGTLSFGLDIQDQYMVENFKNLIGSPHKIRKDLKNKRHMASIVLTDQTVYDSIIKWGIPKTRKTYNLDSCNMLFEQLQKNNFEKDFIRGFLDGDGCIYVGKNSSNYISFTAYSNEFLESINNCIIRNTNVASGFFIRINNSHRLSFYGKDRIMKILNWIYNPSPKLFLLRKFNKYDQLKNKFSNLK